MNFRRFFDVNELPANSVERSEVFERRHAVGCQLLNIICTPFFKRLQSFGLLRLGGLLDVAGLVVRSASNCNAIGSFRLAIAAIAPSGRSR